jgi:hypothetical protein
MIYNETLSSQYGIFADIGSATNIVISKPTPSDEDYTNGYINRVFVKKVNENVIHEVPYLYKVSVNQYLYKPVDVKWKITGPKNNIYKGNILDKAGVTEQNRFEIDRIKKEEGIDLSGVLNNPLEYWRGN